MKHIESELFLRRKEIEKSEKNEEVVDWFSTLEGVKTAKKRLYNPRHRTPEAQKVWNNLPDFLEKNKSLLSFYAGTGKFTVNLSGSMLLGLATEGKKDIFRTELWRSDIDLLVFTGKKDENEEKYREKHGLPQDNGWPRSGRLDKFIEQSNLEKEFNRSAHGMMVEQPLFMSRVRETCSKFSSNQEITNEDWVVINFAAKLFGSDALFQSKQGLEAKWRNEILKIILENEGGENLWNEVRKNFNLYLTGYANDASEVKHRKRADLAFDRILSERKVKEINRNATKESIRKMRAKVQLPEFQVIQGLK